MTEKEKKELIRQICDYGTLKEALRMYLDNEDFEKYHKTEDLKNKILSEIIDTIKAL